MVLQTFKSRFNEINKQKRTVEAENISNKIKSHEFQLQVSEKIYIYENEMKKNSISKTRGPSPRENSILIIRKYEMTNTALPIILDRTHDFF